MHQIRTQFQPPPLHFNLRGAYVFLSYASIFRLLSGGIFILCVTWVITVNDVYSGKNGQALEVRYSGRFR